jgi:GNAT superfamily N-acetyltransferase
MKQSYDAAHLDAALPAMSKPNPILLASGTFYLAHSQDGQFIGGGGWSVERPGSGDVAPHLAHLRHFATHPDWTRLGVGRAIYLQCERAALTAGAREFECFSALNAVSFYEALGFKTASIIPLSLGPGAVLPAVLMKRSL